MFFPIVTVCKFLLLIGDYLLSTQLSCLCVCERGELASNYFLLESDDSEPNQTNAEVKRTDSITAGPAATENSTFPMCACEKKPFKTTSVFIRGSKQP